MRASTTLSLLGLAASQALAACPYHQQMQAARSEAQVESAEPKRALGKRAENKTGVFFMNRIAPSESTLYIANADGSNERALLPSNSSVFEYQGHWTPDGKSIIFTSERVDGQADIYQVSVNGSGMQSLVATSSYENNGILSPDGTKLAYVSTANNYMANIWIKDLITGEAKNLTNTPDTVGLPTEQSPDGHFRPAWSPDGEWIAFSSDRNTDWTGHSNGTGWEHTQELSIYAIRPDGSDFRLVANKTGYCLGTPAWSPDGSRIAFYETVLENTYNVHRPDSINTTTTQIGSVDFATGTDVVYHTSGDGVKLSPHWVSNSSIGYLVKGVPTEGINYTVPDAVHTAFTWPVRNPQWSPDGTQIVYERTGWDIRPLEKTIYSWQDGWEARFMDVFPQLSKSGKLLYTAKQTGNETSNIVSSSPNGDDYETIFSSYTGDVVNASIVAEGLAGSFQPTWSPTEEWVAFGLGYWFFERSVAEAYIYRATSNGSTYEFLTGDGVHNVGFPSYSPNSDAVVYREWNGDDGALGLRILNITTGTTFNLTDGWDTTPGWSPDGTKIVFTRNSNWTVDMGGRWWADRYDVYTINPDGTELTLLTTSGANDAHAVWSADNRILYNSGMYGFRDECALYDDTFQPYGQIMSMDKDGSNKIMLTDSMWEDSMPLYVPNEFLE